MENIVTVVVANDHFIGDVVGINAARHGKRVEALEPIHQGIQEHPGQLAQSIAESFDLRQDLGRSTWTMRFSR